MQALGPEAKEAVPALLARFKEAPVEHTAIARALGSIGPAAKEAVPTLIDVQPRDEGEKMAVQEALRKISK